MALDGAFLHCIRQELLPLTGSRIDKIYQPTRDELILSFRTKGGAVRVLFSVSSPERRRKTRRSRRCSVCFCASI